VGRAIVSGGNKDGNNEELATNCVQVWKATRAMHKKAMKMRKVRKQLVQSLKPWGDNDDGAGCSNPLTLLRVL
jgi:hypothetical protein